MKKNKTVLIIGAGPAGLTAAYELLRRTDLKPIIFEKSNMVGGISRTETFRGNKIDIGGHRFFSKSDRVMDFWKNEMDFLVRSRKSRIYYLKKFFDYPVKLNLNTIKNLGFMRMAKIGASYCASLVKKRKEFSLEDFMINSFGKELYLTFFKSYTEKVWGVQCKNIKAEWGKQRIKGLSIASILKSICKKSPKDISQKNIETSLIEKFMYPKYGPGQFWEHMADKVIAMGGAINMNAEVISIRQHNNLIEEITVEQDGKIKKIKCDYLISSMPIKDLILRTNGVGGRIKNLASSLLYRDFITVGILADRDDCNFSNIEDNWIYIQEENSTVGRIQIFNNWSPHMVKNPDKIWFGLEYFCNEGDRLWNKKDGDMKKLAISELSEIGFLKNKNIDHADCAVIRVEKAYPCYFGEGYDNFGEIKNYLNSIGNLFPIGRNGMHRYNNMDHSMLTAMEAVNNIIKNVKDKENIWEVNTEREYHEKRNS